MTLVVRYVERPVPRVLERVGPVLVSLCEVVGSFGSGPLKRVVFLGRE